MFITTSDQFKLLKKGQRVSCIIDDKKIQNAKINIDEDGYMYICQNYKHNCGPSKVDRFEYKCAWKCAWRFSDMSSSLLNQNKIENLRIIDIKVGDFVVDDNKNEHKVIEVLDNSFLLSCDDDFTMAGSWCSFEEISEDWKISNMQITTKQKESQKDLDNKEQKIVNHLNNIVGEHIFSNIKDVYDYHFRRELKSMPKEELIERIITKDKFIKSFFE